MKRPPATVMRVTPTLAQEPFSGKDSTNRRRKLIRNSLHASI
ncbi:uncharacterized protein METZ01_LOCUS84856 [marine metagenome]|uniref:Uncharacterized protein n=1 Tax=marine metagenome TaxID=408172 RepID=A0A381UV16_9ZZZZ